jgi:tetratricopeptide (TPR) repeat protein
MRNDWYGELEEAAWSHIKAGRFADAKVAVERLISRTAPPDSCRLWHLYGLLGSVLNSLHQTDDATAALGRALEEAHRIRASGSGTTRVGPEIGVSRYMLANQYLIYGDPAVALAQAMPIPEGSGHIECLLRSVAAQALWKLERRSEAYQAASDALAACPADERLSELRDQLAHILGGSNSS